jgi:hypothetical protein
MGKRQHAYQAISLNIKTPATSRCRGLPASTVFILNDAFITI